MVTTAEPPTATVASASTWPSASASAPIATPQGSVSRAVVKKICAAQCGGTMSMIDVYRDATGKIGRLRRLYGSCSHNAALYFDAQGNATETIPEKPVVPGSAEAKDFSTRIDAQVAGLTQAENVSCGSTAAP